MINLKKILLNAILSVAVLLVPVVVLGATTVGNNVSVGGTLDVTGATTLVSVSSTNYSASGYLDVNGATTLDGAVTLGDSVGDSITITGKLGTITISDGSTTSTLAKNSFIVAGAADFDVGKFYVDSSGNVTASGTLGIVGATTLNGNVTLGDATTDYVAATAYFRNTLSVGNGETNTSTFTYESIVLGQADSFDVGKFNVDLSGNTSASGTLKIVGATTLNGAVTLGDSVGDSITITGKLGTITISDGSTTSTLAKNSFIVAGAADFDVGKFYVDSSGNVTASGTLGIVGATTLNGNVTLGDAASDSITATGYFLTSISVGDGSSTTSTLQNNLLILARDSTEDLGKFFVSGAGAVSVSGTIQTIQTATSTIVIDTTDVTKGTCFVVRDIAGTQKFMTILTGNTIGISTVDCRL